MKVVIPGGSGQVGTILARAFHQAGHEVVVLSRKSNAAAWRNVNWDAETLESWAAELDGADVVINLAGRSVNCRYYYRESSSYQGVTRQIHTGGRPSHWSGNTAASRMAPG